MRTIAYLLIFCPFYLTGQNHGLYTYPEHLGKLVNQIIKNKNKEYTLLSPFYADFDGFEQSNVCELDENNDLVNCIKLSDSTLYWNIELSYDSSSYILTGIKCSTIEILDTVIIEKRDLDFKLIQKYCYYINSESINVPIVVLDSVYHLFVGLYFKSDDNLLEFIIPPGLDLTKINVKTHNIKYDLIDYFKPLKEPDSYIAWYFWGLAKVDSSFSISHRLNDSVLIRQGGIIDAIDSGFVAFGSAKTKESNDELGIVKYGLDLKYQKIDTFGMGFNSIEAPAVAYPISKSNENYFVTALIGINIDLYTDTSSNMLYIGKYNKNIDRVWLKKVGGDRHYLVWGVEASKNGGCCIYGMCRSKETKYKTIPFIMCVDENGSITSVEEQIPNYFDFTLLGNPGGNDLKFNLEGSSSSFTYKVANLKGQIVSGGIGNPGLNIVSTTSWPAGVYVISFINKGTIIHSEKWVKVDR